MRHGMWEKMRNRISGHLAITAALSLVLAPTAASASARQPLPTVYSPMVTLSILGSGISAAALCGALSASAASSQAPAGGCVLPAVDAPPPVAVVEPAPPLPAPYPVAAVVPASTGFLVPLIGGLAALVGVLALIGFGKNNPRGGGLIPPPPPITPQ